MMQKNKLSTAIGDLIIAIVVTTIFLLALSITAKAGSVNSKLPNTCHGKLINPVTDVCWSCLFPLSIGNAVVAKGNNPDTANPKSAICHCSMRNVLKVGLSVGYWEPARVADVTTEPFCFVGLGGHKLNLSAIGKSGTISHNRQLRSSTYQAHWYVYPLLSWLNLIDSSACQQKEDLDVLYLSEFDPLWQNDALRMIVDADSLLLSNLVAQSACSADCIASTFKLPLDKLYWCSGCQGSMFPLTGHVGAHLGGVQASSLIAQRVNFLLHKWGVAKDWDGQDSANLCHSHKNHQLKKSIYRQQMLYPVANTNGKHSCNPLGKSTLLWEAGKEYPIGGEMFSYLVWRKHNCCVL
jgi:conjugal transfer pilus assembly protein TraU